MRRVIDTRPALMLATLTVGQAIIEIAGKTFALRRAQISISSIYTFEAEG
ncbi:MAG: hypothetical protein KG003_01020 [Bacteroidetes bacterium]|nr:hypothetical protein [Bacteroidota bacterium]